MSGSASDRARPGIHASDTLLKGDSAVRGDDLSAFSTGNRGSRECTPFPWRPTTLALSRASAASVDSAEYAVVAFGVAR